MTLKERIEQEAIKYSEFNKFGSDRRFEFNRDKVAFTNGAYFYFDKVADEFAIGFAEWLFNIDKEALKKQLNHFKEEKGL